MESWSGSVMGQIGQWVSAAKAGMVIENLILADDGFLNNDMIESLDRYWTPFYISIFRHVFIHIL